jgi:hypothetical protein
VTTLDANPGALLIAKDAILDALNALPPTGWAEWDNHKQETVDKVTRPRTGAARLARVYTAQFQDNGQTPAHIRARHWKGLIVVKAFGATDADARAAVLLIATAMASLSAPAGWAIFARRPKDVPLPAEAAYRYGVQYEVEVRKVT